MTNLDNIKPLLEQYVQLVAQKKHIEAQIEEINSDVRKAVEGAGEVVVGNYSLKCVISAGRKTIDKEALLAAGVNVEAFMKVGHPFTTLTVKEVTNV